jgi:acetylglutamate kinase
MLRNLKSIKAVRALHKTHAFSQAKLHEAIPFIREFSGKKIVLKLGGSVLEEVSNGQMTYLTPLVEDIIFLKQVGINVILVHGGSRQLNKEMESQKIINKVISGLRVTTPEILKLAKKVFSTISHEIKKEVEKHSYKGIVFAPESGLVKSKQIDDASLGLVGIPQFVDTALLDALKDDVVPIVSSITAGMSDEYLGFNVNADVVAGAIASAIKAEKLILMTDVEGVRDNNKKIFSSLTVSQAETLISSGIIQGGMIPKVETCLGVLRSGVHKCHIIKGDANSFIDEILTIGGVGTEFTHDSQVKEVVGFV